MLKARNSWELSHIFSILRGLVINTNQDIGSLPASSASLSMVIFTTRVGREISFSLSSSTTTSSPASNRLATSSFAPTPFNFHYDAGVQCLGIALFKFRVDIAKPEGRLLVSRTHRFGLWLVNVVTVEFSSAKGVAPIRRMWSQSRFHNNWWWCHSTKRCHDGNDL